MKTRIVTETHFIENDDNPANPVIRMTVQAKYRLCDDGFLAVQYLDGSVDYPCANVLPI